MISTKRIPVSDLRLARWLLWARLWLELAITLLTNNPLWNAAEDWAAPMLRAKLNWTRRLIIRALWLQALRAAKHRKFTDKRHGPRSAKSGALRAALGSRLRRLLRGKSFLEQVGAMLLVLKNADKERARLIRRLARGFTRGRHDRIAPRASLLFADLCAPAAAATLNSS